MHDAAAVQWSLPCISTLLLFMFIVVITGILVVQIERTVDVRSVGGLRLAGLGDDVIVM